MDGRNVARVAVQRFKKNNSLLFFSFFSFPLFFCPPFASAPFFSAPLCFSALPFPLFGRSRVWPKLGFQLLKRFAFIVQFFENNCLGFLFFIFLGGI